jgi:hypothetical protein
MDIYQNNNSPFKLSVLLNTVLSTLGMENEKK